MKGSMYMNILLIGGKFLPIYNRESRGAIQKLERIYFSYNESKNDKFIVYSPKIANDNFDNKKLKNVEFRNIDLTSVRYRILRYIFAMKRRIQRTGNNEYYIRQIIKDIKRRGEENKYDLIIFENEESSIPVFKKKTKTKTRIALHLHNDYINVERSISRTILNNCDEVWCVSKYIESRVKEVKNIKTVVIPNTFESLPGPDATVVSKLKKEFCAKGRTIFLYVGRLLEIKGIRELIESYDAYSKKYPNSRLIIIGDFNKSRKDRKIEKLIRSKISRNPNIHLAGYKKPQEIANYYKIANVQIIPSKCNEAFGLVVLEAMQANVRIIASSHGAFPEICGTEVLYVSKENMVGDLIAAQEAVSSLPALPSNYYMSILKRYGRNVFTTSLYSAIHNNSEANK